MSAKPESNTPYATKVAIPRRLYQVAIDNARLISQVTLDAYKFIHSRCSKDAKLVYLVTNALNTLAEEYERGEHTKAADMDFGAIAQANEVALAKDGRTDIAISLPEALYAVAEANQEFVRDATLQLAPLILKACNGSRELASIVCTMSAQVCYYDESIKPADAAP